MVFFCFADMKICISVFFLSPMSFFTLLLTTPMFVVRGCVLGDFCCNLQAGRTSAARSTRFRGRASTASWPLRAESATSSTPIRSTSTSASERRLLQRRVGLPPLLLPLLFLLNAGKKSIGDHRGWRGGGVDPFRSASTDKRFFRF